MRLLHAVLIAGLAGTVLAQTTDPSSSFEVASVKAAAPQGNGRMMMGGGGGPGTRDPGRYTMTNMPLKMLLAQAYDLKQHQVTGPAWLETEHYDIVAKVPAGATKEQMRVMLQNLLKERFKIELHREKKDQPIYILTVAKSGSKLKETTLDASAFLPPTNDGAGRGGPPPGPPPPPRPGEFPKLPEGRAGMMMMFSQGHFRLAATGQGLTQIADFLTNQLGRTVVDKTGLTGKYDFQLDFAPELGQGPMRGMPMLMPPPGAGGRGEGGGPVADASDPGAPNLLTAVQELGLKLDSGKGPVDILVIDKGEKVPVEN